MPPRLAAGDRPLAIFANIYYAFGHGHLGMASAAPTGRHIANLMARRPTLIDLAPFAIDRF